MTRESYTFLDKSGLSQVVTDLNQEFATKEDLTAYATQASQEAQDVSAFEDAKIKAATMWDDATALNSIYRSNGVDSPMTCSPVSMLTRKKFLDGNVVAIGQYYSCTAASNAFFLQANPLCFDYITLTYSSVPYCTPRTVVKEAKKRLTEAGISGTVVNVNPNNGIKHIQFVDEEDGTPAYYSVKLNSGGTKTVGKAVVYDSEWNPLTIKKYTTNTGDVEVDASDGNVTVSLYAEFDKIIEYVAPYSAGAPYQQGTQDTYLYKIDASVMKAYDANDNVVCEYVGDVLVDTEVVQTSKLQGIYDGEPPSGTRGANDFAYVALYHVDSDLHRKNMVRLDELEEGKADIADVYTKAQVDASQASQDTLIAKSWKQVNLHPFFSKPLDDGNWFLQDNEDFTPGATANMEMLDDGWVRITLTDVDEDYVSIAPILPYKLTADKYTLLVETRNSSCDYIFYFDTESNAYDDSPCDIYGDPQYNPNGYATRHYQGSITAEQEPFVKRAGNTGTPSVCAMYCNISLDYDKETVTTGSVEFRLSLYEGEYYGRYVPWSDSPDDIKARVAELETSQESQDAQLALSWKDPEVQNLHPFFSKVELPWVMTQQVAEKFESSEDGFIHYVGYSYTSGTLGFAIPNYKDLEPNADYTLLIELSNVTQGSTRASFKVAQVGNSMPFMNTTQSVNLEDATNGIIRIPLVANPNSRKSAFACSLQNTWSSSEDTWEFDIRISLYKGNYTGGYVPFDFKSPWAEKVRIAYLEEHQDVQDTQLALAWKDPAQHVNLGPFFSQPLDDDYYYMRGRHEWRGATTFYSEGSVVKQADGWARIRVYDGDTLPVSFCFRKAKKAFQGLVEGAYTLLIEMRNLTWDSADGELSIYVSTGAVYADAEIGESNFTDGKVYISVDNASSAIGSFNQLTEESEFSLVVCSANSNEGYVELRLSLYEGSYNGPYVPYDPDAPRLKQLERGYDEYAEISADMRVPKDDITYGRHIPQVLLDAMYYAFWFITFYSNDGDGPAHPVAVIKGGSYEIPSKLEFNWNGWFQKYEIVNGELVEYEISGFNTNAAGTGTAYTFGSTITPTDNNTILYAQWTPAS